MRQFASGSAVLAAWLVSIAIAALWLAPWIGTRAEGVIGVSSLPLWAALAATSLSVLLTAIWATRSAENAQLQSGRRRFLLGAAAAAGGLAGTAIAALASNLGWFTRTGAALAPQAPKKADAPRPDWSGSRVRSYRRLGRTNVEVSDISLGSTRLGRYGGEEVARLALDRGVTYIDTAPDYVDTGSELAIGRALEGRRDRVFLATKFCRPDGHLPKGSSVSEYVEVVEASLRRLRTDHVDLVHIHSCEDVERLMDENVHEAFDRLREQGKARFLGVSTHTPSLVEVANTAIESDRFDVLMLAYHHGAWPQLGSVIERAASRDIGVVAMKTLKGARHRKLLETRAEADSYTQAAFKWVLSNPAVSCLVISMNEPVQVDEFLYASGRPFEPADVAVLEKYDELVAGVHCFQHCGQCLGACPEGLRIDEVLRHRMYFEDYGDEKEAMRLYARLPVKADVCSGCSAPCAGACPHGIAIQERTTGAHALLTLA
jgi:predicted aldo/keto reductase-like oxidoreductase